MAVEKTIPTTPDIGKLTGMTQRTVWVTRIIGNRKSLVVSGWKNASVEQITGLHTYLPLQHGSGTFHFEVSDEAGSEKVEWLVRLGPDTGDVGGTAAAAAIGGVPMSGVQSYDGMPGGSAPGGAPGGGGAGGGSRHLGHGYYYDEVLGIVTTPQKTIHEWRPGQPLPGGPPAGASSPWGGMPGQNMGWGQYPTGSGNDDKIRLLEDELKAERERRRDEDRRREAADMRAAFEKSIADTNARFEALITKLADKPAGPSASEEMLRREIDSLRQDQAAKAREDVLRAEIRAAQERMEVIVRENNSNKQDPMLSVLGQLFSSQTAAAASNAQAIKDTAVAQLEAARENSRIMAERFGSSALTPERMLEMLKIAKDQSGNAEAMKGALDMYRNLFSMSQDVLKMQAEMYQGSQEPAWVGIAQQAVDRIGAIAGAYAQRAAQPQPQQVRRPQPQQPQQQPQQQRPAPTARDAAAAQVFKKPNGANGAHAAAVAAATAASAAPAPAAAPVRRRRAAAASAPAAGATPSEKLANAPTAEVKAIADQHDDPSLFGLLFGEVEKLRAAIADPANNLTPVQIANFIMQAQQFAAGSGEMPPAVELLVTGHIDLLVERLLPASAQKFRDAVADQVRIAMRAAGADFGADDDDADDDDGEGDGKAEAAA